MQNIEPFYSSKLEKMASLSGLDKQKFERLFEMGGGYVLDFSNRTFRELVIDQVKLDIYSEKYNRASGSKANRLRAFWSKEGNSTTANLLSGLLDYWKLLKYQSDIPQGELLLFEDCKQVVKRLSTEIEIENLDIFHRYADEKNFIALSKSIIREIEEGNPEIALDRLHTFMMKYLRGLFANHEISFNKDSPINSLLGGYIKYLRKQGLIASKMTQKLLGSSVKNLEYFNKVRNEQSLAHDNELLNQEESLLIFNNLSALIKFIASLEEAINSDSAVEDKIPL